jgi:hypothetical protein
MWQPIETAPNGGQNVLTYGEEHGFAVAWSMGSGWFSGHDEEACYEVTPTHWMPLPDRPTVFHRTGIVSGGFELWREVG